MSTRKSADPRVAASGTPAANSSRVRAIKILHQRDVSLVETPRHDIRLPSSHARAAHPAECRCGPFRGRATRPARNSPAAAPCSVVRKPLPLLIAVTAKIQHQPPHWIRRIDAIIENVVPCRVAMHRLILAERRSRSLNGSIGISLARIVSRKRDQHRMRRRRPASVNRRSSSSQASSSSSARVGIGDFIAQIVRPAAIRIHVVKMLVQMRAAAARRPR